MNQIRICGAGGQGVVLAGILLGQAGMLDGKHSAQASSYGAEARGSACRSEVILSEEWIDFPHVTATGVLVALSQQGYDTYSPGVVADGGMVFFDPGLVEMPGEQAVPHFAVPATEIALNKLGRNVVANMVMLGALSAATGLVTRISLEKALKETMAAGVHEVNLEALAAGFVFGESLRI